MNTMNNVFVCFVGGVLIASSLLQGTMSDENNPHWKEISKFRKECAEEAGVTLKEIGQYNMPLQKDSDFIKDEKVLCAMKCTFTKLGYLNEDGTVDIAKMKEADPKFLEKRTEDQSKMVFECLEKVGKIENCAGMVNFQKCLEENSSSS